ncbi:MAG: MgtC/SapB family protein [Thermoplasmatota archaeon]
MAALPIEFGEFFVRFLTALGIGALIGLEREHRRDQTQVIAGVRTFPLFALAGFMLALVAQVVPDPVLLSAAVLSMGAITIAFLLVRHQLGVTGLTTPMAMLVTFLIGIFIGYGFEREAILIGVATTFLLLTKQRLHRFAELLTDDELSSALQFIVIAFVLFPLAANAPAPVLDQSWLGRGALVDPYAILLIVVVVSAVSFVSFVAMRALGAERGILVSGVLGGFVNSEATSVSLAEHAIGDASLVTPAASGALLATAMMFVRALFIAAVSATALDFAFRLALPLVPLLLIALVLAAIVYRSHAGPQLAKPVTVKNPFALGPAVKFAGIFAAVSLIATLLARNLGDTGVYLTALGGLVGAGAVVASVATLYAGGHISLAVATETAVLATAAGVANKFFVLHAANRAVYARARVSLIVLVVLAIGAAVAVPFLHL